LSNPGNERGVNGLVLLLALALVEVTCMSKANVHFVCQGQQPTINGRAHTCSASAADNPCFIALGCKRVSNGYQCPTDLPSSPIDGSFCSSEGPRASCGDAVVDCSGAGAGGTDDPSGGAGGSRAPIACPALQPSGACEAGGPTCSYSGAVCSCPSGTWSCAAPPDMCRGGGVGCPAGQYFASSGGTCAACSTEGAACVEADCTDCCAPLRPLGGLCVTCTPTGTACRSGDCNDCCGAGGVDGICVDCLKNAHCDCPAMCLDNRCQ